MRRQLSLAAKGTTGNVNGFDDDKVNILTLHHHRPGGPPCLIAHIAGSGEQRGDGEKVSRGGPPL